MIRTAVAAIALLLSQAGGPVRDVAVWGRFDAQFNASRDYDNALYDVARFAVHFTSPSGRLKTVHAFWDGGRAWRVRFMPDERGAWSYVTEVTGKDNAELNGLRGTFTAAGATGSRSTLDRHGALYRPRGSYHLAHADGTPFFWAACTAWNGALKSSDDEWEEYLTDRVRAGYSVVQFVSTQWRGGADDEKGDVAFDGSGRIRIHPAFFQRLDRKIERINAHGLVAAPVVLWALQRGVNRELSPGYHLPDPEAILLARYIVARYGAHHVVWLLGGDGLYTNEYEQRWKNIGRAVFGKGEFQGVAGIHSQGRSWIGQEYAGETWLDVIGYQSSHNTDATTVNWITKGPVARDWPRLPPRVLINMEPAYEASGTPPITARDVRSASYWSLFSTPVAGISYGGNAIWPWSRAAGEPLFGHPPRRAATTWREALRLPGSVQIGRLAAFFRRIPWWTLRPAQELLLDQPGDGDYRRHISVMRSDDGALVAVYAAGSDPVRLANPFGHRYDVQWFDPVAGDVRAAAAVGPSSIVNLAPPFNEDAVAILRRQ